jgi:hypothetical protein
VKNRLDDEMLLLIGTHSDKYGVPLDSILGLFEEA